MQAFGISMAAFILLHSGVAATGLRSVLVRALKEPVYRGLFSLASLVLLILAVRTYNDVRLGGENVLVWAPPSFFGHVAQTLVLLGFLVGVTGLLTPGPTLAGAEKLIERPEPAKGVLRVTRHPFLWGVALWAGGHLLANGDLAGMIFFGGFLLVALAGTRSIDRKTAARDPANWARFQAATSNVPFAAILQKRNALKLGEMGWRLAVAIAAFVAVYLAHPSLFGVTPRL